MASKEKSAFVTGAARGIGRAIAETFARNGYSVAVADIDLEEAQKTARHIQSAGGKSLALHVDVRKSERVHDAVAKVMDAFGRIDVLVNNAGITGRAAPVVEMRDEEWSDVLAVDLYGVFYCTRAVLPYMLKTGFGRVINIASIAGKEGNPNMTAYSAAKGAVIAFTKAVAKELIGSGVLVHCVAPGVVETDILRQLTPEQVQYMLDRVPLGRFGRPEEVAHMVLFLASESFSFSTGACFDISGGRAVY